ncbi:DnaJ domain containing protein [Trema orientale]|uniref:DnaJ domain containing protein n=1 Tax=Trema orientale TaxID=63057 RepID=A0A2P5ESH2_TREOI|nr:DnaJ domain containing protein [Trema orientale]
MEANKEEALKAKEIAEKRFFEKDFAGAKNYALKAKALYPGMEGISQMVATFEVYVASEVKSNGEADYYSILGLKPFADKEAVKKQYRKMAVMLHPDKNKCVGADGAFKLVSEAWTLLSDNAKRKSYDHQRNKQSSTVVNQTNLSSVHASGVVTGFNNCSNSSASHGRLDTFWTVCTSCKVQYEYLRKYVNKRLSCKNCRGVFIAVETGTAPANGSFPYAPWSYVPGNGYAASHGYDGVTYVPSNTTFYAGNGVSGFHSGHGFEYVSNVSFQWSSFSGTSVGVMGPTGPSSMGHDAIYHAHGNVNVAAAKVKTRSNGKRAMKNVGANGNSNLSTGCIESPGSKVNGPDKRRKLTVGASFRNGYHENVPKSDSDAKLENGNASSGLDRKLSSSVEVPNRRCSAAPAFDARKLLIDKARTEILKKLEEIKLVSAAEAAVKKSKVPSDQAVVANEASKRVESNGSDHQLHGSKTAPLSITVPDSDFHDFDKDRSEESFKPKQIWALYDEEDGMPRLYCLIREVISVKPFKILITYLSSKTDSEFGAVNWLDCGFTKSCGNFRAYNSDVVDQVNVFSHLLSREKAGRGGCVRIYPRSGDIWAVYRNWSPDWDRSTPDEVRHQYEMVEVLDDYSEELGCCVSPLVKVTGFKTVYGRSSDKDAIRWIPRREMVRFSHQVPSWLLKGEENNLPEKCWDLDPAATPDELLHAAGAGEAEA